MVEECLDAELEAESLPPLLEVAQGDALVGLEEHLAHHAGAEVVGLVAEYGSVERLVSAPWDFEAGDVAAEELVRGAEERTAHEHDTLRRLRSEPDQIGLGLQKSL